MFVHAGEPLQEIPQFGTSVLTNYFLSEKLAKLINYRSYLLYQTILEPLVRLHLFKAQLHFFPLLPLVDFSLRNQFDHIPR